ncbi:prolipoprotein diacylglyceryl transferase [Eisenibacter elegans]|uniref:prolipoprotein diacylglyceryl transferase n=1 Tax=Eisenibacter elegans TaxID=997 RepID=UPI0003F630EC|nr:prolipoprotein diacylglyceryl transferase [Eisenibacter elegans]
MLSAIVWSVSPEIIKIGAFSLRWYGLLFAAGFLVGNWIMTRIFAQENKPERDLEQLLIYMVVGTILGARLGHVLFYGPYFTPDKKGYFDNPLSILYVWEGGLASHGAAIAILIVLYLYSRTRPEQPFLWVVDRIVIPVALAGGFIRLGNLMNSEIIGRPADLPWSFVFVNSMELSLIEAKMPRHPAQLYEALFCFALFGLLTWLYNRQKAKTPHGLLLGVFLTLLFTFRFLVEFVKENQVAFEDQYTLNMGQILSIPAVLGGLALIVWVLRKAKNQAAIKA